MASQSYRNGELMIQDLASQRMCAAIELEKGDTVYDMCAGAGGKSLSLAMRGAKVYAWDIRSHALKQLQKHAKRMRLRINIGVPKKAQIVLVDAPCSGIGRLRREPGLRWRYQHQNPLQHVQTQKQLLLEAQEKVSTGGCIVYATCSLLEEENSHVLPGWQTTSEQWIWPQDDGGDGFYWKILRRKTIAGG